MKSNTNNCFKNCLLNKFLSFQNVFEILHRVLRRLVFVNWLPTKRTFYKMQTWILAPMFGPQQSLSQLLGYSSTENVQVWFCSLSHPCLSELRYWYISYWTNNNKKKQTTYALLFITSDAHVARKKTCNELSPQLGNERGYGYLKSCTEYGTNIMHYSLTHLETNYWFKVYGAVFCLILRAGNSSNNRSPSIVKTCTFARNAPVGSVHVCIVQKIHSHKQ